MRFEDFARLHGLIMSSVIPNKWVAVPTEDKPRSTNGRYKYLGEVAFVQNWATMDKPVVWHPEGESGYDATAMRTAMRRDAEERNRKERDAIEKANRIITESKSELHPYLASKGFPKDHGIVWYENNVAKLVLPMRYEKSLRGVQLINPDGTKKFLYGQRTKGAYFCMDGGGIPILCEGYATALSIKACMQANKVPCSIYVCFSASNLKEIASTIKGGIVVADNDANKVGESSAKDTGKPYWLSDKDGEDFNDYHQRVGIFTASQSLKKIVSSRLKVPSVQYA
jgi:putative DNA primase/helicase